MVEPSQHEKCRQQISETDPRASETCALFNHSCDNLPASKPLQTSLKTLNDGGFDQSSIQLQQ